MDYIREFVDERQKSFCIHCGVWLELADTNKDHVPSKSLLHKPYPDNLPVVTVCTACNKRFSADEEYLSIFLHCVLTGSTDPVQHVKPEVSRALRRHGKLRAKIEKSKTEFQTIDGKARYFWKPEMQRVERVVVKNARGHAFYECGEPMLTDPEYVWTFPLNEMSAKKREEFENTFTDAESALWPEVGSRMMIRCLTGQDMCNGWVIVQDGVYRFSAEPCDGILVRSVLFEYLATEVYWWDV